MQRAPGKETEEFVDWRLQRGAEQHSLTSGVRKMRDDGVDGRAADGTARITPGVELRRGAGCRRIRESSATERRCSHRRRCRNRRLGAGRPRSRSGAASIDGVRSELQVLDPGIALGRGSGVSRVAATVRENERDDDDAHCPGTGGCHDSSTTRQHDLGRIHRRALLARAPDAGENCITARVDGGVSLELAAARRWRPRRRRTRRPTRAWWPPSPAVEGVGGAHRQRRRPGRPVPRRARGVLSCSNSDAARWCSFQQRIAVPGAMWCRLRDLPESVRLIGVRDCLWFDRPWA